MRERIKLYQFFGYLLVPPTVEILKPTNDVYRVHEGQELALVCRGRGDPTPTIKWKRQVIFQSLKYLE